MPEFLGQEQPRLSATMLKGVDPANLQDRVVLDNAALFHSSIL